MEERFAIENSDMETLHLSQKGVTLGVTSSEVGYTFDKSRENRDLKVNEVFLTVREAVTLTGLTKVQVHRNRINGKYRSKIEKGNGGEQFLIALTSLPESAQRKWVETAELTVENWEFVLTLSPFSIMRFKERWTAQSQLPSEIKTLQERRAAFINPDTLTTKEREYCQALASILRNYADHVETFERGSIMDAKTSFVNRYNAGEWPFLLSHFGKTSWRTLDRHRKTLKAANGDIYALAPRYRKISDLNIIDRTTLNEEQQKVLLARVLSANRPSIQLAVEQANRDLANKGQQMMVYKTALRFINEWKRERYNVWIMSREGEKSLNDKVLPYIQRNPAAIEAGDVVVMDGWRTDFDFKNPRTGKPCRGVIISVLDMRTNMLLGWEVMPTENVAAIATALRRAIKRLGFVPRVLYIDNGKAFRAKFFQGVNSFQDTFVSGLFERFSDFGFKGTTYAWAYHGQSKTIEPFHRMYASESKEMVSYRGNSIEHKPARLMRGETYHRNLYEKIVGGYLPTIEDVHEAVATWVDRYENKPQQGTYLQGLSPIEAYSQSIIRVKENPDWEMRVISEETLNFLMMEEKQVAIFQNGVKHNGEFYYHDDLMPLQKGEKEYKIKYDLDDDSKVYVYDRSGKFLCVATKLAQVHPMAKLSVVKEDHEELRRQIELKKAAKNATIRGVKEIMETEKAQIAAKVRKMELPATGTDDGDGDLIIDGKVIKLY